MNTIMDIFWRFLNHICLSPPPSQTRFTLYRVGEEELPGIYKGGSALRRSPPNYRILQILHVFP